MTHRCSSVVTTGKTGSDLLSPSNMWNLRTLSKHHVENHWLGEWKMRNRYVQQTFHSEFFESFESIYLSQESSVSVGAPADALVRFGHLSARPLRPTVWVAKVSYTVYPRSQVLSFSTRLRPLVYKPRLVFLPQPALRGEKPPTLTPASSGCDPRRNRAPFHRTARGCTPRLQAAWSANSGSRYSADTGGQQTGQRRRGSRPWSMKSTVRSPCCFLP